MKSLIRPLLRVVCQLLFRVRVAGLAEHFTARRLLVVVPRVADERDAVIRPQWRGVGGNA